MRLGRWAMRGMAVAGIAVLGLGLAACGDDDDDSGSGDGSDTTSQEATETITLGYVTTPQHPYGLAIDDFVANVGTASGGALAFKTLPTYGGGNDIQLLNDIRGGTVKMGSVSSAVWEGQGVPDFEALQMPFLINNYAVESAVLNSDVATEMLKGTEALGLTGLAIHEGGLRKPVAKGECLVDPATFEGVKMRSVESPLLVDSISALGAEPTPLPLSDVYLALKQGTVDALEANLGLVYTQKFYEVSDCITGNVNLWPFPTVLVANTEWWNSLSEEQQGFITEAAANIDDKSIEILTDPSSTLVKDLCDAGMKFATATEQQREALRTAVDPVYSKYEAIEPTGDYISQIEQIAADTEPPPAPAPYPDGCAAE